MTKDLLALLKERGLFVQANFEKELKQLLNQGSFAFYVGFDPTAPSLHIGNYVLLHVAQIFQAMGHIPHVLLGSGTALIGDPTGRMELRQMMSRETIAENTRNIKKQIRRFLGSNVVFCQNETWLKKLNYIEVIRELGPCFSVNKMLATDAFSARWERGLTLMELNYMVLQAYDFYYLNQKYGVQLQIGGSDQWANILAGADLIRRKTQKQVYGMTTNLLVKANGEKMGKSASGALWLDPQKTSPYDFYQYWINLDDASLQKVFLMLTKLDTKAIETLCNLKGAAIKEAKAKLAFELTDAIHGTKAALAAQAKSARIFAFQPDTETKTVRAGTRLVDVIVDLGLVVSRSEARRVIQQGGLTINQEKVTDVEMVLQASSQPLVIGKGKKRFVTVQVIANTK
ncbi:tyrosine--tRNA ligase [Mycoplasmoides pneumoniae]|uniref:Tyrosine--tRNA ligase n=3 Tax=Mycoplasmoides pneumoniae TaxID=2104 RepID=A0AAV5NAV1_MYCPM|nr:tyrosine--tRNA ligase [Mycoplasmoides pneumoniae]ADK87027.1 tyrosine--tRNA ligase [Mycoplasmoides pneumoniae FH]ALA30830.1 tRNA synthetase RNA-binding protein [Mycoplasmoides pneumoniae 19294]ALA31930.1 tRNA synthetase RNA-binding protein [Mycoplasmoides pneumoniae 39443]ALA36163.1 tRNA synthetase RNA-binding protein [Mycoplasmoides pneumoniae FH]ALA36873.1 tRNA synthetase RNA-binding protein [Mycoplasmoides pneumoniae M1139]